MDDSVKITAIIVAGTLLLFGGAFVSCNYDSQLATQAPVVESCIKHPSIRSPFRGSP
jgi:hypothetical protein